MEFDLTKLPGWGLTRQGEDSVLACNAFTARYGLRLSSEEAAQLVKIRDETLRDTGRVELNGGILDKLISAFCDSPYLSEETYTETLEALVEAFYYFKNESLELLTDDELLSRMRRSFDGDCHGAVELLMERDLEELAHDLRFGDSPDEAGPASPDPWSVGFGDYEDHGGSDWGEPGVDYDTDCEEDLSLAEGFGVLDEGEYDPWL